MMSRSSVAVEEPGRSKEEKHVEGEVNTVKGEEIVKKVVGEEEDEFEYWQEITYDDVYDEEEEALVLSGLGKIDSEYNKEEKKETKKEEIRLS